MLGDKIKKLREQDGISRQKLGDIVGVHRNSILNWENNKSEPDYSQLKTIAEFFSVSMDYLLEYDDNDIDEMEKLKVALKEAGMMKGDDLTREELQKALEIVELLKKDNK